MVRISYNKTKMRNTTCVLMRVQATYGDINRKISTRKSAYDLGLSSARLRNRDENELCWTLDRDVKTRCEWANSYAIPPDDSVRDHKHVFLPARHIVLTPLDHWSSYHRSCPD
jgi:hypothetical protein